MADNGNGGLLPPRRGFEVHNTKTGERECYIPLPPNPEQTSRNTAIWRETGERLGLIPPCNSEGDTDA